MTSINRCCWCRESLRSNVSFVICFFVSDQRWTQPSSQIKVSDNDSLRESSPDVGVICHHLTQCLVLKHFPMFPLSRTSPRNVKRLLVKPSPLMTHIFSTPSLFLHMILWSPSFGFLSARPTALIKPPNKSPSKRSKVYQHRKIAESQRNDPQSWSAWYIPPESKCGLK